MARKKFDPWADELKWAAEICAFHGCSVERSTAQYEVAKVKGPGVSLVIYPHTTTASHWHARVRDNNSKDKAKADRVIHALNIGEGLPQPLSDRIHFSCTFSRHFQALKPKRPAERNSDE